VNKEKMLENINATKGLVYSQHLMLELIKKGATRMEAYDIVQTVALRANDLESDFKKLVEKSDDIKKYLSAKELEDCFSLEYHLRHIDTIFKGAGLE